jgi:hypothetical protein
MLAVVNKDHPHRMLVHFRGKLFRCLARDAPSKSRVGASDKTEEVQSVFGCLDVCQNAPDVDRLLLEPVSGQVSKRRVADLGAAPLRAKWLRLPRAAPVQSPLCCHP